MKRTTMKSLATWVVVLALGAAPWMLWASKSGAAQDHAAHGGQHSGTEAEGHGGGGEEAEEHGQLGDINWADFGNKKQPPYLAYLMNFAILIFIYYRMGAKAIPAALEKRRDDIAREIEEAQRIEKEAKARAKKYQRKLENLDEEVEETKKALVEAGQGDKERIIREAEEKATRMERDAKALLENESKQVRQDLTIEAIEAAVLAAQELLEKRVTQADQERLAEEFLAQLAQRGPRTMPPAPAPGGGGVGGVGGGFGGKVGASIPPQAQTGGTT